MVNLMDSEKKTTMTAVKISVWNAERLKKRGKMGDSYNDVIEELLDNLEGEK